MIPVACPHCVDEVCQKYDDPNDCPPDLGYDPVTKELLIYCPVGEE